MKLLHLSDWNDTDKYYEVPTDTLVAFKETIRRFGISAAWRWFTDQVDYSADASGQNKPIKRVDDRANHTLDTYFLDWQNAMESSAEWDI